MHTHDPGDPTHYTSPHHCDNLLQHMRATIKTPNGDEIWGNVQELHYNSGDDTLYVRGSDGSGGLGRERRYYSADFLTVALDDTTGTTSEVPAQTISTPANTTKP